MDRVGLARRHTEGTLVTEDAKLGFATRLTHLGRSGTKSHGFVNPPLHRGSTVLYENMAQRQDYLKRRFEQALSYGLNGSATHHALEDVIAAVEGGTRCQIVSTGLAACTVPLLAYLGAGDHVLIPDSVYGPVRIFCNTMLKRLGITTTYYDATIAAGDLAALFLPETRVLYLESPGSHSFEVQDVPGLAAAAHSRDIAVLMDNTWGIQAFQPFDHGVDVSIQALTKYAVGHSDVLLGSATVREDKHWRRVRDAALVLGQYASPDDCWLALRGLRTMAVRLAHQMKNGLTVAEWFAQRPEVLQVLHPALPGAPGHELWKRDFTGACSLFGVVFRAEITVEATHRMVNALKLFGIGASWGGYESLALPTTGFIVRTAGNLSTFGGAMVRFHIGLEDPADLIADLEAAFFRLAQ
jgi:cystathionine beta-lyase